jgi:hypothetical protein
MKSRVIVAALLVMTLLCMTAPLACAQGEAQTVEAPVTFGWIVAAWLIYSLVGFFASGEPFNGLKFARTFLVTIIVAFAAIALRITPANVLTSYGSIIDQFASIIINTGPGIGLIYLFEKLFKFSQLVKTKLEKAKELAPAPGPQAPKPA